MRPYPSLPRHGLTTLTSIALVVLLGACGGSGGGDSGPPDDPFQPPDGPDVRLDADAPGAALSVFPEIAASGDSLHVVWYDRRAADTDVYYRRSLDGGLTWGPSDVRLDTDAPGAAGSNVPRLAVSGTRVYVAWSDQRGSLSQIRFNRSLDAGATWLTSDVRLDGSAPVDGSSRAVSLCADGDSVFVVWEDDRNGFTDIYFNRSLDAGTTWLIADVRLDTDTAGVGRSRVPQIACVGSTLHVVWEDDRNGAFDVRYTRSIDGGATWPTADTRLDTDLAGAADSLSPVLAAEDSGVCVLWQDARSGLSDIRANASTNGGIAWLGTDVRVEGDGPGAAASSAPAIARRGSLVFAVWEEARFGERDIHFSRSSDAGLTWLATDTRLDLDPPGAAISNLPRVAASPTHVHVTWQDNRKGAFDVLLTGSADDGDTWLEDEVRLDTDEPGAAHSLAPRLVTSGARAHVVFFDDRDGPGDVYYNAYLAPGP